MSVVRSAEGQTDEQIQHLHPETRPLTANPTDKLLRGKPLPEKSGASVNGRYQSLPQQAHDKTPTTKPTSKRSGQSVSRTKSRSSWGWHAEVWSITLATTCFAAMVALLVILHEKPLPKWPSGISVNAVLSVLVTAMKGALVFTIAEGLSQLKWAWFEREQKLSDLVLLDEASRGSWGASKLLFAMRAWYLAYLGTFVLICAVVQGPTVQQTVEIRVRQVSVLDENATMPICNTTYYNITSLGPGVALNRVNLPVGGAMYNGLMQNSMQQSFNPNCRSGNCTFPTYQSLGIVANCTDRTDELVYYFRPPPQSDSSEPEGVVHVDPDFNKTITAAECSAVYWNCETEWAACNLKLSTYATINGSVGSLDPKNSLSSPADAPPAENPSFFTWHGMLGPGTAAGSITPPPSLAVECTLHFAVYTYNASMTAGNLTETILSTSTNNSHLPSADSSWGNAVDPLLLPAEPCFVAGGQLHAEANAALCLYNGSSLSGRSIYNTLRTMLTGCGKRKTSNRPYYSTDPLQGVSVFFDQASYYDTRVGSFEYVVRAFDSLALAVTNHARGDQVVCGGASVLGTQWVDEIYLRVRWAWLVPTAVLLVLSVLFLGVVVVVTRADGWLWKSSPLGLLVLKPSVDGRELSAGDLLRAGSGGEAGVSRRSVEETAKGMRVVFRPTR